MWGFLALVNGINLYLNDTYQIAWALITGICIGQFLASPMVRRFFGKDH